jgi:phage gp36-like protein
MAYLTTADYLKRYGERETILATNTAQPVSGTTPTYDSAKVENAINDATQVVEGYVGKRYAVPLSDPPAILIGFVAVLAREQLHAGSQKMTQTVQDAADRVRSQLRDIAKGDMTLPLEEGQEAPAVASSQGYARSSGDRSASVFGGGRLDELTAPFTGRPDVACWRR